MKQSEVLKACMSKSVLCWLATASKDNLPNVSPKEIFAPYQEDSIIVANIASPQSVKNIKQNPKVCISFLDILVQKGFQVKGKAEIIQKTHPEFQAMEGILTKMTEGKFPFSTITKITGEQVKPIIAPRYLLYPETTEQEQIASARKSYGL
ncbi:pyridoxamine 5'-phosphate oxidase family protein [Maribacter aurantiacus]|uniref:Pyridoxamine 5'-phosphate oxidase family protein n=1 Tax=Maribacter aurantiacus TaxID=1882343 RepID=A0A5R8M742_9FLAO|nr:pyridoxamine 5'-phosphate oxidase family protein [Maribacter aurantiacus]TLF45401.1 pyridoxamine 5'-phosphate oxidase family protein [Maribacter aurantiacus]